MNITIEVIGGKEIQAKLKRLGETLYEMPGAMRKIGEQGVDYYSGRAWSSRGGVFGSVWPPLAASTVASRTRGAKKGTLPLSARTNTPLEVTGTMHQSFASESAISSVKIGNTAPYFIYHQSSAPRSHLPRRQMIGINAPIKQIIADAIKEAVRQKLRS